MTDIDVSSLQRVPQARLADTEVLRGLRRRALPLLGTATTSSRNSLGGVHAWSTFAFSDASRRHRLDATYSLQRTRSGRESLRQMVDLASCADPSLSRCSLQLRSCDRFVRSLSTSTLLSTAAAREGGTKKRTPFGQATSFARELLFVVLGAIVVSSLLRMFLGQMFIIPSQSMENTLLIGDRVVVQKLTDFRRGDVVVFADPARWLSGEGGEERGPVGNFFEFVGVLPDTSTGHLIKRVIGMPGDRVICCDSSDRITINGQALDEASYLFTDTEDTQVAPSDVQFEVVVPRDRIFVMGDNRDQSADSRCHLSDLSTTQKEGAVAFVPIDLVVGPAFAIAAPFDRAQRLHRPEVLAQVPAPTEPAPAEAIIKPKGVSC